MVAAGKYQGPVDGPVTLTFLRYVVPSVLSLLAISTASVVDGFFVGNFVGAEALAAVNLLMPYFALLFGFALMLAVGGSVRAGTCLGQGKTRLASEIFSKTLIFVVVLNAALIPLVLLFDESIFALLGASEALFPQMRAYFGILCVAMCVQLCSLVIYYFIRVDNQPELGMQALMAGAAVNIVLDALFIYGFDWGLRGAALATLFGFCTQLLCITRYFRIPKRQLRIVFPRSGWLELWRTAGNGFSEFINEISIGLVILVIHWIAQQQHGIEGIAAFSVVNYLIYVSLMVYYGIVDAMHGLLSQNFGAGKPRRVAAFLNLAATAIGSLSLLLVLVLFGWQTEIAGFFLGDDSPQSEQLAQQFIALMWPVFLFNGFNVLVTAYLTSAQKALHSAVIATARSLILPVLLALVLNFTFSGNAFIYAIPLAEGLTFLLAVAFITQFRPRTIFRQRSTA